MRAELAPGGAHGLGLGLRLGSGPRPPVTGPPPGPPGWPGCPGTPGRPAPGLLMSVTRNIHWLYFSRSCHFAGPIASALLLLWTPRMGSPVGPDGVPNALCPWLKRGGFDAG